MVYGYSQKRDRKGCVTSFLWSLLVILHSEKLDSTALNESNPCNSLQKKWVIFLLIFGYFILPLAHIRDIAGVGLSAIICRLMPIWHSEYLAAKGVSTKKIT